MTKQLTTNHCDQVISKSWRNNLLQIMAIKLSQSHGETTYYKSWRSSYLKVMAKQLTTNHGDIRPQKNCLFYALFNSPSSIHCT